MIFEGDEVFFKERKHTIICIAAGLLIGGFFLLRYVSLQRQISFAKQEIAKQDAVIAKASVQRGQLDVLKEQLLKFQNDAEDFDRRMPSQRDLGVFLQEITALMNEQGLKEQLIEPGEEVVAEKFNCIPVAIHCRGRLEQLFAFYKSLPTLDRLVRIEEARLVNDKDFSGQVNMETKAVIYYRADNSQG